MANTTEKPTSEEISKVMKHIGSLGGIAHGELVRSGEIPVSGKAVPIPTICPRCGVEQPSARIAWRHCRVPKKKAAVKKSAKKKAQKR
jgi:hypothetical protein